MAEKEAVTKVSIIYVHLLMYIYSTTNNKYYEKLSLRQVLPLRIFAQVAVH